MAGTITQNITLSLTNGTLKDTLAPGSKSIVQTTAGMDSKVIVVGNGAEEDFPIAADIATLGYAYFENVDSTNYVTFGPKSGGVMVGFIRLKAGENALVRLEPGITIRGQANTADVRLRVTVYEE